jgi:hypothetical protein
MDIVPSYVLYGTINHCMKCTGFSHDFANAAKAYDSDKLIDTKQKLTEHWNEVHIAISRGYVVMQSGIRVKTIQGGMEIQ